VDALLRVLAGEADAPVGFMGRGGELTVDVNEQNPAACGFYEALGFVVVGRSPVDDDGRPFRLLHMRRPAPV
jgi:putative acetyltransferase